MTTQPQATGKLIIVSAPSGAGKTSLARALVENSQNAALSVSHTTRPVRPGERNGVDYFFCGRGEFERMIRDERFLEYAEVFGNLYGTSLDAVEPLLRSGTSVLLDIDWQGARKVRARMPDAVSLFILPPSRHALEERLRVRGQDSEEVIASRMRAAASEASHYAEYDWVIVNEVFENALDELRAIVDGRPRSTDARDPAVTRVAASLLAVS